ncbi:hypothetical protein Acor_54760 [Acrocarpospora corrugata]|uniref:Uncharacterized protein n=1 Tax=Acrocarpospora corrugata TaxID=35763 RepID=A0A5M3W581_9ACTN|nr:hypothetical protein [Acrocarpospora corrugata]GES03410.1 hypothetical protein Acor_54760 [Acrocarpospora corrugata]
MDAPFHPEGRHAGSDYNQHYIDLEPPDGEQEAFLRRARQIMGLDPETGPGPASDLLARVNSDRASSSREDHMTTDPHELERHCVHFVRTWGEAVLQQVDRLRTIRTKFHRDGRNYERLEEWSPTQEDLDRNFRELWAEEHTLVWAAYQLERWNRRLVKVRGGSAPVPDVVLANVRNTLEHLDDADFDDGDAVPGARSRSLQKLPNGRLVISAGSDLAFGLIDPDELERRALSLIGMIEDDLERAAVDRYLDMLEDERRGR